ncbi:MAG: patatin-like phospholipase family protein [Acidimicrobiales bacterium]
MRTPDQDPRVGGGVNPGDLPRPLAFVLSGGGAWGAAQVGMIRALTERGVRPDLVVGSSVGALNGSMVAADPERAADRLTEIWSDLGWLRLCGNGSRLRGVWNVVRTRRSLVHPSGFRAAIGAWLPVTTFAQLAVPLGVVVTDAATGRPEVVTDGALGPALAASAAIPGVFPPVALADQLFIDGGISANLPMREAVAAGARGLIILDAVPAAPRPPIGPVTAVFNATAVSIVNQRSSELPDGPDRAEVLRLPGVTPATLSSFDYSRTEALIDVGYRSTADWLDRPEPVRTGAPDRCTPGPGTRTTPDGRSS